jgi:NADPH:quinone reductase-like Zn-dependent oxidoreductase
MPQTALTRLDVSQQGKNWRFVETYQDMTPGPRDVLIQVAFAGLNFADVLIQQGLYQAANDEMKTGKFTPGFEVSGTVMAVGGAVKAFQVGDRVMGVTRFGGFASQINLPEDHVFACPANVDLSVAAGIPTVFMTAYIALKQELSLLPAKTLLVRSAAGGVGQAALQLAKIWGLHTTGWVSLMGKAAAIQGLADTILSGSLSPDSRFDLIMEPGGGKQLQESMDHLADNGTLVVYGANNFVGRGYQMNPIKLVLQFLFMPRVSPLQLLGNGKRIVGFNLVYWMKQKDALRYVMSDVLKMMETEKLKPLSTRIFPLSRFQDALDLLHSGEHTGKIVFQMPQIR